MNNFKLSATSLRKLEGVHPDLIKVVNRALILTSVDFSVTEGLRTVEQEKAHVANGTSTTMNSRHLTGHAVDLTPWANRASANGDDPADWHYFASVAKAMKMASMELKIPIEWGGDWKRPVDGYHFELTWTSYPLK
ncbi:MAG: M15 family metallopeptidase [Alphaproteobacteria bacterium]|nr:M15 family metallopeptidase [Alphaproteobacteria bacterium]